MTAGAVGAGVGSAGSCCQPEEPWSSDPWSSERTLGFVGAGVCAAEVFWCAAVVRVLVLAPLGAGFATATPAVMTTSAPTDVPAAIIRLRFIRPFRAPSSRGFLDVMARALSWRGDGVNVGPTERDTCASPWGGGFDAPSATRSVRSCRHCAHRTCESREANVRLDQEFPCLMARTTSLRLRSVVSVLAIFVDSLRRGSLRRLRSGLGQHCLGGRASGSDWGDGSGSHHRDPARFPEQVRDGP